MEKIDITIHNKRWIILFTVVLMTFMSTLDSSIVNVALPVMASTLSVSMAAIGWVVTSYLIIISATILIYGRLGDIIGKTKIFKFGIIVFTFGSLMCGLSQTLPLLVAARIIQALGAAASMATSQGIITQVFPENERGRALGISGSFVALGSMVGPPLGGFIVSSFSWEYIFLINVPIGIAAYMLGRKTLLRSNKIDENLDLKGGILFILSVVLLFGSLTQGQDIGYRHIMILLGFIFSAIAFITFIYVERKTELPLLQLEIFENRLFSLSIFCGFITFIAISCTNIIQPFYLESVQKFSPRSTGFLMMVYPVILFVVAPVSGYLSDKIGSEFLTFIGLLSTSCGLFLMSTLKEHSPIWMIIVFVVIMSVGNGLFQSPNNSLIMSTVPKSRLGIAGSVNALVRNLGMVMGVSLSTTLLYSRMSYKIGYHVVSFVKGREDVFVYGMKYVYMTAGMICIVGAVLTAFRLYGAKRKRS